MADDTTAGVRGRPLRKRKKNAITSTGSNDNSGKGTDGKELAKVRQIKYRLKQERTIARLAEEGQKKDWIEANRDCCKWIELKDVVRIRQGRCGSSDSAGGVVLGEDTEVSPCCSSSTNGVIDPRSLPSSERRREKIGQEDYSGIQSSTDIDDKSNAGSGECSNQNNREGNNDSIMTSTTTAQQRDDDDEEEELTTLGKWIEPYLDLKDTVKSSTMINDKEASKTTGGGLAYDNVASTGEQYFIAEGTETVRLLIQHCAESSPTNRHTHQTHNSNVVGLGIEEGEDRIRILSIMSKPGAFFDGPVNLLADIKRSFPSTTTTKNINNNNNNNKQDDSIIPTNGTITKNTVTQKEDQNTKKRPTVMTTTTTTTPPFKIILGSQEALSHVVGFPLSRGAMATGVVPRRDESWLYTYLTRHSPKHNTTPPQPQTPTAPTPIRILAIDRLADTANLGSLLRTAAAFGITAVILSNDSCDAWYRRCVRVSMGHVVSVPSVRVTDLAVTLGVLEERFGVRCHAAVVDDCGGGGGGGSGSQSKSVLEDVEKGEIGTRWCCVMGNEADGVSKKVLGVCRQRITIGMVDGVDSLSVGVATGILLHGMREREERL